MAKKKASSNSGLSAQLLATIKKELQRKKEALSKNIDSELSEMQNASKGHHLADMDDLGGEANDEETSYKILEIETAELSQINKALERIEEGNYGSCEREDCGKAIGQARLKALPFAAHCIDCQRLAEMEMG